MKSSAQRERGDAALQGSALCSKAARQEKDQQLARLKLEVLLE